jgi:hypothetical protein
MSSAIHIYPNQAFVWVVVDGPFGIADLSDTIERIRADDRANTAKLFLWDLRTASLSISGADLRALLGQPARRIALRAGNSAAVLTDSAVAYGIGRMAEIYTELLNSATALRVFRSLDEALAWLGIDPSLHDMDF